MRTKHKIDGKEEKKRGRYKGRQGCRSGESKKNEIYYTTGQLQVERRGNSK